MNSKNQLLGVLSVSFLALFSSACNEKEKKHKLIGEREKVELTSMKIDSSYFNFGNVLEGDTVSHYFVVQNIGNSNLFIQDVSSSCGCTIPVWPKKSIPPFRKDSIKVLFTKKIDLGNHKREVIIRTNTEPEYNVVQIAANILKRD